MTENNELYNVIYSSTDRFHCEYFFSPVVYRSQTKKGSFTENIRKSFFDFPYIFNGEVKVKIQFYFNEAKRYNYRGGDLDNYLKRILDAISGYNGIIIDDIQIQSVLMNWVSVNTNEYFDIEILPLLNDDYLEKPIYFYEFPDKLCYPYSYSLDDLKEKKGFQMLLCSLININAHINSLKEKGYPAELIMGLTPIGKSIAIKFPIIRVRRNGFDVYPYQIWTKSFDFDKILIDTSVHSS